MGGDVATVTVIATSTAVTITTITTAIGTTGTITVTTVIGTTTIIATVITTIATTTTTTDATNTITVGTVTIATVITDTVITVTVTTPTGNPTQKSLSSPLPPTTIITMSDSTMQQRAVVILSGVRTAIGAFGGALSGVAPTVLAATVVREALRRSSLSADAIGHCVFGNVAHSDRRDAYLARCAALDGGLVESTPALTVNRLCGSGLQAVVSAAQCILLGDCDAAIAGGAENMSRVPHWVHDLRQGKRMGDGVLEDAMLAALHDPFDDCHMGVTAENVAAKWNINREQQDRLAVDSHRRAVAAISGGFFREQIVPVKIKSKKKNADDVTFDTDEHPRADANIDALAAMRPVFKEGGSVTAGNSSGINDAASALVLMEESAAKERELKPLARLVAYDHAGVAPKYMGIGPVPAVQKVLARTKLKVSDLDVIELNEAFAAQALAVMGELKLPSDKTNPNGSGISLGHPIGATGAILMVKAIHELKRSGGRYALITMCIGGGQGIAAIVENIN